MARTGDYSVRPKPDIYLALIILTTVAMIVAITLMWLEKSALQV